MKAQKHNPTSYFFQQSENISDQYMDKINEFTKTLIDTQSCVLCKEDYNLQNKMPRIMVHCGHTFCTDCISKVHKNYRVRCPLCLKLVKNITFIERLYFNSMSESLPINHTIFKKLVNELNAANKFKQGYEIDSQQELYQIFQATLKREEQMQQEPQQQFNQVPAHVIYQLTGQNMQPANANEPQPQDEMCEYHPDRIKHFFCLKHKVLLCRVCTEMLHSNQECLIMDIYEVENVAEFLRLANGYNMKNLLQQQNNLELYQETNELNDVDNNDLIDDDIVDDDDDDDDYDENQQDHSNCKFSLNFKEDQNWEDDEDQDHQSV